MGKHSHRWTEWTDWQWSQHDQTYIRTRWNEKGRLPIRDPLIRYRRRLSSRWLILSFAGDPQTQYHDETPRTENEDAVSQVAQGLANVQLGHQDESIGKLALLFFSPCATNLRAQLAPTPALNL